MGNQKAEEKKPTVKRELEKKWGKVLIREGWTPIPNIILQNQRRLGLDAQDFALIMVIASHWWVSERLPFPSKKRMATYLDLSTRQIQRRLKGLEDAGLLKRNFRPGTSTIYSLEPLIEEAENIAKETRNSKRRIADQEQEIAQKMGKPNLEILDGGKNKNMTQVFPKKRRIKTLM